MPVITTRANASATGYGAFLGAAAASTAFESIATVSVSSGGAANVEFTSIPSTYTHLQIRGISRSTRALTNQELYLVFNSNTALNYRYHIMFGNGSVATSLEDGVQSQVFAGFSAGANASASIFGSFVTDILDYTSTNKNKTIRVLGGTDTNGGGNLVFGSGLYFATPAAITSIKLQVNEGNLVQYSHFALYGIPGA